MRLLPAVSTALLMALAGPLVMAQTHEHGVGGKVVIAHDVPADGTTFVGTPNHFAVIVKGDDAVPDFHNNIHIRVVLNGIVIFETTPDSGHDYDGVNTFDVVFPVVGQYSVQALDPTDDTKMVAMFNGNVLPAPGVAPGGAVIAGFGKLEATSAAPDGLMLAGQTVHFSWTLDIGAVVGTLAPGTQAQGRLDHTDTMFEAWKDGRLVFRTKTHTHEEVQEMDYAFPESGSYVVRLTGFLAYPTQKDLHFSPVVQEYKFDVMPGVPVNAVHPESLPMPEAGLNAVVQGKTGGPYLLMGTFDPYTIVGPDTLEHLSALVVDPATGQPVQHVNFEAVLHGPVTHIFSSKTLHEYDGIYEITARQPLPGPYTLDVTATRGDWSDTIHMTYLVAPPVVAVPTVASDVGTVMFSLKQPTLTAGAPGDFLLHGADVIGEPFSHNEVEFRLFGPLQTANVMGDPATAVPIVAGKLHTHDDGDYGFRVAFPEPGKYKLMLSPTPLMANPVLLSAQSFDITVADGPGLPGAVVAPAASSQAAPGVAPTLLLAGIAALALLARRRAA